MLNGMLRLGCPGDVSHRARQSTTARMRYIDSMLNLGCSGDGSKSAFATEIPRCQASQRSVSSSPEKVCLIRPPHAVRDLGCSGNGSKSVFATEFARYRASQGGGPSSPEKDHLDHSSPPPPSVYMLYDVCTTVF